MTFRRHAEAAELAANRTTYSLARELLGTRVALTEARAELEEVRGERNELSTDLDRTRNLLIDVTDTCLRLRAQRGHLADQLETLSIPREEAS
ncbi:MULTISPECIES: hypothetical protein [unclassified Halomonas]|uniref:hypothetical protein n=1 Tax=unclassified Halomonas TaxID=2609666 RepID=UPI0028873901|nr:MULTISPECIES: hypothetical protein [unclassified Halomonas]MDT0501607.1 hypothetical protein [Halomonas sp. PAR7]MDT0511036.1 hypothetical protein [Halomonas sp. LES1]MDT0592447.1 hypothetical protein [Halomonas sp. PAR8]